MGVLLLALALLIATFRLWFVHCHAIVPVVERLGVSMPAVTMRLDSTKADMRNGRTTGWPVSNRPFSWTFQSGRRVQLTRMEGRVHNLLCFPQIGRHLRDLALLVLSNKVFSLLQTG